MKILKKIWDAIKKAIKTYRAKVPLILRIIIDFIVAFNLLAALAASQIYSSPSVSTKSTHDRVAIENPYDFDENCVYDPADHISYAWDTNNTQADLKNACFKFYEDTGVQVYVMYFDIDGDEFTNVFNSNEEVKEYALEKMEGKYGDKLDYAVVAWRTNYANTYPEVMENDWDYDSYGFHDYQFQYGSQTRAILDSEGRSIFSKTWNAYEDSYSYKIDASDALEEISDELMTGYSNRQMKKIAVGGVAAVAVAAGVGVKLNKKKKLKEAEEEEEMYRILNTPMKDLVDEELEEAEKRYSEEKVDNKAEET